MTANSEEPDGATAGVRSTAAAGGIQRGVFRTLYQHGLACLCEFPLPNGRRADVIGLGCNGEVWIVEIKSSLEDFRSDLKWPEYREFCDQLYFAVKPEFPVSILPPDTGLILADRHGGEIVRAAPEQRLTGARRKSVTQRFARTAALRLTLSTNPVFAGLIDPNA